MCQVNGGGSFSGSEHLMQNYFQDASLGVPELGYLKGCVCFFLIGFHALYLTLISALSPLSEWQRF